ncbi:MAG: hypothetical protein JW995_13900 [Melioribacteraceae bacterium]|nr:hypothetical protein [Melioribacteraceae bacterium]
MVNKIKYFLLLVIFCASAEVRIEAQQGSSLFKVISSDLVIQREPVFRELQHMLENEGSNEIKGVELSGLYEKLDDLKLTITKIELPVEMSYNSSDKKIVLNIADFFETELEIPDLKFNLRNALQDFKISLETHLIENFEMVRMKIDNKYLTDILFFLAFNRLHGSGNSELTFIPSLKYDLALADLLSEKLTEMIKARLNFNPDNIAISTYLETETDNFNRVMRAEYNSLKDIVITAVTDLKETLRGKVTDISKGLRGITGFSATKGSGVFNSGLMYTFRIAEDYRFTLYSNINFNQAEDSALYSLFGFRLGYSSDYWQLDFLGSLYFGNEHINAGNSMEVGAAVNHLFKNTATIGLAGFYTYNANEKLGKKYTVGIMFGFSNTSPSIIIGISGSSFNSDKIPLIQLNYPISVNL